MTAYYKTKKLLSVALILALFLHTSCATILNGRYQKVAIDNPSGSKILVDGEEPEMKNGLVKLRRDRTVKQITITKDGYKDEHLVAAPYRVSPLVYVSILFFYYPYIVDVLNPKSLNYAKEISVPNKLVKVPKRSETFKEIKLNNVKVDLDDAKFTYYATYKRYLKGIKGKKAGDKGEENEVKLENTIFTDFLNQTLREEGYIDTSKKVLKNSYSNNLLINATIDDYESFTVGSFSTGVSRVELSIKWEVLDYYENEIYSYSKKNVESGEFSFNNKDDFNDANLEAIKDALEIGLIDLMSQDKVQKLLNDRSEIAKEEAFETITLKKSTNYVSNINEAIKSSVTITNKDGHGSGFIISSDGYILTNYHVIAGGEDLKVVLHDNKKYDLEVIRVSKVYDMALIKIDVEGKTPFKFDYDKEIQIGSDVYAVGTPKGQDLAQTVSKGIISGVRTNDDGSKLIQTDASINSGNSGGAIITKKGEVLGIVSSKYFGFGVEGVAFGIPSNYIKEKLKLEN
ncbi:MAG: trypsin-like peptidase domain-containing protein [Vicingaceae bacterium]